MATTKDLVQIALEETPVYEGANTATTPYRVSATTRYLPVQSARLDAGIQLLDRADEVRGIEGAEPRMVETYEVGGSIQERAYLNDLVFLLDVCGLTDTITQGDGSTVKDPDNVAIPTGAYRHVFAKRGGITAKSMQMILAYVDEGVFLRANGVGVSQISMTALGEYTADLMGLVLANVADPNLSPTFDSPTIPHVRRGDITLTWLASSGITDDFTLQISNPLSRRRTLGVASFFPNQLENGDEKVYLTGTIPKVSLADADFDAMLAATTFAATARWVTPKNIGATTYKYGMWVQMPACQYVGGTADEIANRRRFGGSFDWFAAWDDASGYDFKVTIVNAIPTLSTEGFG